MVIRALAPILVAGTLIVSGTPVSTAATDSWQQVSHTQFFALTALERSQGVATDGASWFFSWRLGISRTTLDGTVTARNSLAIPPELALRGADHIGDIDHHAGRIYAPIEDNAFQRPTIAVYDAATLRYTGVSRTLPTALQTHVPWVAVDAPRGLVYTSDWDPVSAITVLSLAGLTVLGTVPLNRTIGRIQGAKVFQGALYASSDNATQSVYRIDPTTGAVDTAIDRNLPSGTEAEGLAFLSTASGAVMHILDVAPNGVVVNFRGYRQPWVDDMGLVNLRLTHEQSRPTT